MKSPVLSMLALCAVLLAACDEPRPREPQLNPRPQPADDRVLPPPARSAATAVERPGPYAWDAAAGAFTFEGQPLRAGRLWTFEGSTDGFVMAGGEVLPAETSGLRLAARAFDPALRSPSGLALEGRRFSHVLVRVTRLAAASDWDGALHYVTAAHPEAAGFMAKPFQGAAPEVNETVILAYDMRNPTLGGEDWVTSLIESIRLDFDDAAGGEFLIHQIAVTEPPANAPAPTLRPAA
ncbi:hypothetical protein [Phenylobacterium sp.]|uniref:hypothetical protein n=1 Tax=Phenylobacterium sp. TaxID=1871053 RepID=UPI002730DBF1|nr:hypothetical protein [Phenylobacterium sp.]MDP1874854.1 hypothetical protein [Phenylobacterium sp.]